MKLSRIFALCLLTFSLSNLGYAEGEGKAKKSKPTKEKAEKVQYEAPYGMAGCGLWTYVIKDKSRWAQLGTWFLNTFVYGSQTSGITSGTSNCVESRGDIAMLQQEREVFMTANFASLTKEAAQGDGEHLSAFAEVLGCPYEAFAKLSQNRYDAIFTDANPNTVLGQYLNEVQQDPGLSTQCKRLS